MAGVDVYRADAAFEADGQKYAAGTFVIPMAQVFARYAKDILEKQTYPEVRRSRPRRPSRPTTSPPGRSACCSASITSSSHKPLGDAAAARKLTRRRSSTAGSRGNGPRFVFDYRGPDAARRSTALLEARRARVARSRLRDEAQAARVWVTNVPAQVDRGGRRRRSASRSGARRRPAPAGALARARRRASACISRGPAATWTRAGRAGCSSSTTSPHDAAQRRRPRRQAARQVRRDHPARSGAARDHRRRAPARTSGRNTAAASATKASPRCSEFVGAGRHAGHARRGVGPRDRAVRRAGART